MPGGARFAAAQVLALNEGDPFPPEDHLPRAELNRELEVVYRRDAERMADRLGRHGAKAEDRLDLVHEGFARFLGGRAAGAAPIASPAAYIARISSNLLSDRGRASAVRDRCVAEIACREPSHHDQVVYLETRDRLRRLETAILKLKPLTREIFLARRLDGLSYSEIAELTGLSEKAIERHMAKAIAKIMRLMDRP